MRRSSAILLDGVHRPLREARARGPADPYAAGGLVRGVQLALLCFIACLCLQPRAAYSQPVDFGSADDPGEQLQRVWWRYQNSLDARTGFSLIADHWRAGVGLNLNLVTRSLTARLSGTFRGGIYGDYDKDTDELYDLLRLVEFARYNPPRDSRFYLRGGRIERVRLGTGHLVNFFNSHVAWDRRTVGIESMYGTRLLDVAAFTDNVLLDGVVGGRAALRPFGWGGNVRAQSLTVAVSYVTDLSVHDTVSVTAYSVDAGFNALPQGDIRLVPFASFAWYPDYGSGLAFGATVESDNFIDLARFRLRLALYYNGSEFIPGYYGAFYQVSNPGARILNSYRYLVGETEIEYEGVELDDALGGNDFETELRLLIFERFEFWYYFRRHYGTQSLSEFHLRLFLHQPRTLRVHVGLDRAGLKGFFSLFNDLGDQTALAMGIDYRIAGPFWAFIDARYTFEYVSTGAKGKDQYLVQRRFEPFVGIRLDL